MYEAKQTFAHHERQLGGFIDEKRRRRHIPPARPDPIWAFGQTDADIRRQRGSGLTFRSSRRTGVELKGVTGDGQSWLSGYLVQADGVMS
eukprot:SAG11_NODE_11191_length_777_cov_3.997050_1_plen_90_part_00